MTQPINTRGDNEYIALVRDNHNYRNLWLGQVVSLLGDWFNLIGSASLIAALTQSGFAVGGLFVVRMLAPFLVSPLAGVAADRFDRRKLLIITDILRAVIVLGFLLVRDASMVWLLYVLTAVQLAISGFFFPAKNAILPDVVSKRQLGVANAVSSATWSVMLALGAALGGLVSGAFGVYVAFIVDSLTFVISAFFIWRVRYAHGPALQSSDKSIGAALRQYVDGLRYLGGEKDILAISLQKAAISLTTSGPFQVIQVVIAEQLFVIGRGGGISLGILYTAVGVGTGLGPIVARRFTGDRDRALRHAIAWSYAITAVGLLLTVPLTGLGLVTLGTFLRGFGGGIGWVFSTQLLFQSVPDQVRGRVFSTEFAMFSLASAIAAAWAGAALDSPLGIAGAIWLMFILNLVPAAAWTWWTLRKRGAQPAAKPIGD
ncbi:MAG: MFS transporter [Caldilineaceae bacterium]|nr:MFS transporter [Caldilineaceae bacterium]